MRDKLLNTVKQEVKEELERTYSEYGHSDFNSAHEGYAVIKEEVEEAGEEFEIILQKLNWSWDAIRRNGYPGDSIHLLKLHAALLACEAIQIAAMAEKFETSLKKYKEDKQYGN